MQPFIHAGMMLMLNLLVVVTNSACRATAGVGKRLQLLGSIAAPRQRLQQMPQREQQRQLDLLALPITQAMLLWKQLMTHWPGAVLAKRAALTETLEPVAALGAALLHVLTRQQMRGMFLAEHLVGSITPNFSSSSSSSSSNGGKQLIPNIYCVAPRDVTMHWLLTVMSIPGLIGKRLIPEILLSGAADMKAMMATVPGLLASPELMLCSLLYTCLVTRQIHGQRKGKSPVRARQQRQGQQGQGQQQQQGKGRIDVHALELMPAIGLPEDCSIKLHEVRDYAWYSRALDCNHFDHSWQLVCIMTWLSGSLLVQKINEQFAAGWHVHHVS
jgi:hypothetical protein